MEDVAPEPYRTACLKVLFYATIEARSLAWGNAAPLHDRLSRERQERIADLMDAVHNIPMLLNRWNECDTRMLRTFLRSYDDRWARGGGYRLGDIYDRAVDGGQT